jgi:hypothetical protein
MKQAFDGITFVAFLGFLVGHDDVKETVRIRREEGERGLKGCDRGRGGYATAAQVEGVDKMQIGMSFGGGKMGGDEADWSLL